MTTHNPEGKTICIHSVCVDPGHQRQKVGSILLKEYIRQWTDGPYDGISLISHEELIPFYTAAGFKLIGKSEVVHGSKPWFELRYPLQSQVLDAATQRRILEALQKQDSRSAGLTHPEKKLASHFTGEPSELAGEQGLNKLRIYCPRTTCRSVILLAKTATLAERPSITVIVYIVQFANNPYSDVHVDRRSSEPSSARPTSSPPSSARVDIGMENWTSGKPYGIREHRVL